MTPRDGESARRTARDLAPFAGASVLAWATAPVGSSSVDWRLYWIAAALAALAGGLRIAPLRGPLTSAREVLPSLVFLMAVALLRSSAGGSLSGVSVVALLPVFYTALQTGERWQLGVVTIGVAVFFLAPVLLVGAPAYPPSQYRAGVLFVAVSAIVGLTTQGLVAHVRVQAAEALHREQMLEQVAEVVRGLSASPRARIEVCEAAKTISSASVAVLYEPTGVAGAMRSTAMAGAESPPIEIGPDEASGAREALRTGHRLFVTEVSQSPFFNSKVWERSGRPTSVLFEPLLRGSEPVGVLVVGWPQAIRVGSSRTTVIALLAHEVTAVIERADLLTRLASMASTDPLTGLPNRRAWDARLAQALTEEQEFVVAMLDFDHFKQFNDTRGHPAGDRLLKETAAAWREELRGGDLLARIGGEEFALLLPNCNVPHALVVIERLRARLPGGETCSAGLVGHRPGEPPEELMRRVDVALYEAKSSGRDRAFVGG